MQIDGWKPVDKAIALDQGVDFEYPVESLDGTHLGDIHVRGRTLNARDNPRWAAAFKVHHDWMQRRQSLSSKGSDEEAERRFLGLVYDHGVIEWSTTLKSGGKPIEPSRQNFIDLMMSDACQKIALVLFQDLADSRNFRPVDPEEDAKNSVAPSAARSDTEQTA